MRPLLTVIIPTYNGADYLARALASIVGEGPSDVECLAIDDGSTDGTQKILEAYAAQLPLRTLATPRTGNWVRNTNRALAVASGTYVSFLHQDDLWLPGRMEVLRRLTHDLPGADLFVHASMFIDEQGNKLGTWCCPLPAAPATLTPEQVCERLIIQNFIAVPAPAVRTELCRSIGGLDERLWYTADWDLWLRLARVAGIIYCPRPLTAFRVHPQSQTVLGSGNTGPWREQHEMVLDRHIAELATNATMRRRLRKIAEFSIEVNVALATAFAGAGSARAGRLVPRFLGLGPTGWRRYLRDSRILERVYARRRLLLRRRRPSHA